MATLRSAVLRLVAELPKGDAGRRKLLAALKEADEADVSWATMLNTKKYMDEATSATDEYSRQVNLIKALKAGDRVEIVYNDPMRGGEVKTVRIVSDSWDDLRTAHPGSFNKPEVMLEAKVGGNLKRGMITDYGPKYGVVWQGTMRMPIKGVLNLRRM